jgi:uncharacterized protein YndB with AHSA1/START domain
MKEKAGNFTIKDTYIVYSTPEKVFEALVDPGIIGSWGGGLAVVEGKAGGKFEYFDGWVSGEVLVFKPGKELSFTWKPSEWSKSTPASVVSCKFKEHKAGTEIVLTHSHLPTQEEADKHKEGWIDFVFDPLNDYFTR